MDINTINSFRTRWTSLTAEQKESAERIKSAIQAFVEKNNETDINSGIYDCFVSIFTISEHLVAKNRNDLLSLVRICGLPDDDADESREAQRLIIVRCIDELVTAGVLLYVYDKQRVRSRIAELVRYFSYLKQRMDEEYDRSPGLTHMVKLHIKVRKRPKRNIPLQSALREIYEVKRRVRINDSISPLIADDEHYERAFKNLREMIKSHFEREIKDIHLSQFQLDGFKELFRAAVSKDFLSTKQSFIIQSSTGSGKTETFLFPILLYTLLMQKRTGTKALLLYPRIDLCNDQLQRLVRFVSIINNSDALGSRKIKIGIEHGKTDSITLKCPYPGCTGNISLSDENPRHLCDCNREHHLDFVVRRRAPVDILITTPDTLHRRLMDRHGKNNIWDGKATLPKFIVFDEAHIHSNQAGMHIANVVRRLRHKIKEKGSIEPIFIASSATIGAPETFARELFSTEETTVIRPREEDLEEKGREYVVFVKATSPRRITVRDAGSGTRESARGSTAEMAGETDGERTTIATNLSAMIQTAFCFHHAMLKLNGKDKIIGFVDSIDIIKRLGEKLCDAERNKLLYQLRTPDNKLGTSTNLQCPHVPCQALPPNPYTNRCQTYLDGECWWVMEERDREPMTIHLHKSGTTQDCGGAAMETDVWDMMITTSALEVGFDHPAVIGTFQYMAPMNIPGFVQRIGRGGRSPSDMPVAVVVLGSRPLDGFYFHHTTLLTNPDSTKLEIPIDPDNTYVKTMHVVSFIYDYISTFGLYEDVDRNYYQLDLADTIRIISENRGHLLDNISQTFGMLPTDAGEILDTVQGYLTSWLEKTDIPSDDSALIDKVRFVKGGPTVDQIKTDLLQSIVRLGGSL